MKVVCNIYVIFLIQLSSTLCKFPFKIDLTVLLEYLPDWESHRVSITVSGRFDNHICKFSVISSDRSRGLPRRHFYVRFRTVDLKRRRYASGIHRYL